MLMVIMQQERNNKQLIKQEKSQAGYWDYEKGGRKPSSAVAEILDAMSARRGIARKPLSEDRAELNLSPQEPDKQGQSQK